MGRKIAFIEIPSEISAGTRGASLGPSSIRIASWKDTCTCEPGDKPGNGFFQHRKWTSVPVQNHLLYQTSPYPFAKRIDGLHLVYKDAIPIIQAELRDKGTFPIILAGDHGTAAATLKAIQREHPRESIGVVWIDAHADLHTPYTTPSGNMHGMTLALALGEEFGLEEKNEPSEATKGLWKTLLGTYGNTVVAQNLVLVGVRDTERPEKKLIAERDIKRVPVRSIRESGAHIVAEDILRQLSHCQKIYITFDVDCLDRSISVGTGTPVIDGFAKWECIDLLNDLLEQGREKVAALEIVEVNPTLDDKGNKMAEVAFEILKNISQSIENDQTITFNRFSIID